MQNGVIEYYNNYDEDGRLFRDYNHQIEWLTTIHYFNSLFQPNSKIFDGCAGTGNYAFKLAEQGHSVVASDIVPHNVDMMLNKQKENPILQDIFVGDICKQNQYEDESFDVVLCMGAFYHIDKELHDKAMKQCLRLLKKNGILVITYINLMAALNCNIAPRLENIDEILKGYAGRNLGDSFIYMTPDDINEMAENYELRILNHLTSDGNPLLRGKEFNGANKENFEKYMQFHLETCENKSTLGYGLHGLVFLTRK